MFKAGIKTVLAIFCNFFFLFIYFLIKFVFTPFSLILLLCLVFHFIVSFVGCFLSVQNAAVSIFKLFFPFILPTKGSI